MIDCSDCLNYKTRVVRAGDDRANSTIINGYLEKQDTIRVYYCKYKVQKERSTIRPGAPIPACRLYDEMDGKGAGNAVL